MDGCDGARVSAGEVLSGRTREDYYIFVQGCFKWNPLDPPCQNAPEWDWHVYLAFLRQQFQFSPGKDAQGNLKYDNWDSKGFDNVPQDDFVMWARQHIKFVLAPDSNPFGITQNLHQISRGSGNIYLIGHSAGGTAVIRYLTELKESRSSNPGIAGAVAIDTPLQGDLGFHKNQAPDFVAGNRGFDRFRIGIRLEKIIGDCPPLAVPYLEDRLAGLGTWAQDQGIRLLQVSYADDVFNPRVQIGDISQVVVKTDENYANKSIQDKHGYLLTGPGSYGLISGLFAQGVLK